MAEEHEVNITIHKNNASESFLARLFSIKIGLFLLICVIVLFLALPNAKASDITILGTKSYSETTKTYSIKDYLGLSKVVDIQLVENTDYCMTECYALIKIAPYIDFKVGSGYIWQFYNKVNMKEIGKGNILKDWRLKIQDGYYNESVAIWGKCESTNGTKGTYPCIIGYENVPTPLYKDFDFYNYQFKKGQEVIIRLEGTKDIYASIEWIPTFADYRLDKWAPWNISQIAYYTFDVDTNGYFNDSGTDGNKFNLTGNISAYVIGVSAALKNASNYTSTGRQRATANITNFASVKTIDYWFIETDTTANQVTGVGAGAAVNDDNNQFELNHYNGDADLNFYFVIGASVKCNANYAGVAAAGSWHHMVITGIGTKILVYIDNVNIGNCTNTSTIPNGWNLTVGNFRSSAHYEADASIDNLLLSNTSYTVADVAAAYNSGAGVYYGIPPPSITTTLYAPINGLNTTNATIYFNCSATTAGGLTLQNITLYGNWSGGWHANETVNISGTSNSTIFTKTFSNDGSYKWNCLAWDDTGAYSDWADANFTFSRDTVYPTISITSPTYSIYNTTNLTLNYSYVEINPSTCWYSLNKGSNTTIANCANTTIATSVRNNTITLYINDSAGNENSSTVNFDVGMISSCNGTIIPTINFTFKDEGNSSLLNGTLDVDFYYWISAQTVNATYSYPYGTLYDYNFTFCIHPDWASVTADYDVWYKANGYPQRRYSDSSASLTNTTTQKNLWLLQTADGMYVRFITVDKYNHPISFVTITMTNPQTGYTIEVEDTDDSGLGTFWVNPDTTYTFTFQKTGYTTQTKTMRPTSTEIYYVSMEGEEAVVVNESAWVGIIYSIYPDFAILVNNTVYNFRYNISDDRGVLINYGMYIYNASDVLLGSASGSNAYGGNLSVNIDIGGNKSYVYGIYNFSNTNGTIIRMTRKWKIEDYVSGGRGYSLWTFFVDLKSMTVGGFNDFTRFLLVFLLIFGITGFVSYNVGTFSVKGTILMIMALVIIFGVAGLFEVSGGMFSTMPSFMQKYLVPFIIIILGVGFIFLTWEKED